MTKYKATLLNGSPDHASSIRVKLNININNPGSIKRDPGYKASGSTLLELLAALTIFTIALFSIYSSAFTVSQSTRATRYYQQASQLTENLYQYLQSHHYQPAGYLTAWQADVQTALPHADSALAISSIQTQIKITWGGMTAANCHQSQSGLKGCVVTMRENVTQ